MDLTCPACGEALHDGFHVVAYPKEGPPRHDSDDCRMPGGGTPAYRAAGGMPDVTDDQDAAQIYAERGVQ